MGDKIKMPKIKINVFVDRENKNKEVELEGNSTVAVLLEKLDINPVTVIISRDNELILENEKLNDNDKIKVLSVISGG